MSATPASETPFGRLHHDGPALRLPNAWDGLSARVMELAGAAAVGTTSFGVAVARGHSDGERLPWEEALRVYEEIVMAVQIPVTVDVESGRGRAPATVATTTAEVASLGAAGINLEDSAPGMSGLLDVGEQCERLAAARGAAGSRVFVNARCDAYFTAVKADDPFRDVVTRAERYASAGADGLFVPGLLDLGLLAKLTAEVSLPVNVMVGPGAPSPVNLEAAGVRRLSLGASGFAAAAGHLYRLTAEYLEAGLYGRGTDAQVAYGLVPELAYRDTRPTP